jgi:hypothetical protein
MGDELIEVLSNQIARAKDSNNIKITDDGVKITNRS